ncbi:MAG: hypothetical protein NTW17_00540 [Candidatus Pacearchaeota archaeon]|nr:hypothetical protein [Candidatus Pacearchaeota archaeon]
MPKLEKVVLPGGMEVLTFVSSIDGEEAEEIIEEGLGSKIGEQYFTATFGRKEYLCKKGNKGVYTGIRVIEK